MSPTKDLQKRILACGFRWSLSSSSLTPSSPHQTCSSTSQRLTLATVPFTTRWKRALASPTCLCCLRSLDLWAFQRYWTSPIIINQLGSTRYWKPEWNWTKKAQGYQLISVFLNDSFYFSGVLMMSVTMAAPASTCTLRLFPGNTHIDAPS